MRILLLLFIAAPVVAQRSQGAEAPQFKLSEQGTLAIGLTRNFLELEEVREQLESGLTTSFAIHLLARNRRGPNQKGFCRIDIRYEPWDQIYFLTHIQYDGRMAKETLESFEALVAWFTAFHTKLVRLQPGVDSWVLETTIDLLPFSEREAERTQRWFHEHLGNKSNQKRDPNKVLDLLVTSSIRRKPLNRYNFRVEFWP